MTSWPWLLSEGVERGVEPFEGGDDDDCRDTGCARASRYEDDPPALGETKGSGDGGVGRETELMDILAKTWSTSRVLVTKVGACGIGCA